MEFHGNPHIGCPINAKSMQDQRILLAGSRGSDFRHFSAFLYAFLIDFQRCHVLKKIQSPKEHRKPMESI
jgi:hypothetical protein